MLPAYRAKPRIEHALQPLFFFYCSLTSPGGCTAEISPYVPVATLRIDCLPSPQLRMGLKSNDPFKSAVGPLDLDTPFIAISKYHVENRVFRNGSHSVSIAAFRGACKTDRAL